MARWRTALRGEGRGAGGGAWTRWPAGPALPFRVDCAVTGVPFAQVGIGAVARVKINASIGTSAVTSSLHEEVAKLELAVRYGADTVMDLSTGRDIDAVREAVLAASTVPVGTVPIYQVIADGRDPLELTAADLLAGIEHQARQGVDYMTLHAGILLEHLPHVYGRVSAPCAARSSAPWHIRAHWTRIWNGWYAGRPDECGRPSARGLTLPLPHPHPHIYLFRYRPSTPCDGFSRSAPARRR